MVAWGENMVKGASHKDAAGYSSGDLLESLPSGSQSAQERLMQTQETLVTSLGLSAPEDFASRFKNFDS